MKKGKPVIRLGGACRFAAVGLLLVTALAGPASGGSVVRLPAESETTENAILPGYVEGAWRDLTQLVWDRSEQRLARRVYRVWDPLASRNFALVWVAGDAAGDRDGAVSGAGRLIWRKPGAASYDKTAIIAQYTGALSGGRAAGHGEYLHRSGGSYRGGWKGGLMEGHGRLQLPNGDEYVGFFKSGRRHGPGTYIDRAGIVYEGGFTAGLRDGHGRVRLPGEIVFNAVWRAGEEVAGTRVLPSDRTDVATLLAQHESPQEVQAGITVDRQLIIDPESNTNVLAYAGQASEDGLKVLPDNQRLLDVWRGRVPIQLTPDEQSEIDWNQKGFLGEPERYKPVRFVIDLLNRSRETVRISGARIEVAKSVSDHEPAVQVAGALNNQCYGRYETSFNLENFGWSDLHNVRIFGGIPKKDSGFLFEPATVQLDLISLATEIKLDRYLPDIRIPVPNGVQCDAEKPGDCMQKVVALSEMRPFAEAIRLNDGTFSVPFTGRISYDWKSADGRTHSKTSDFNIQFNLNYILSMAECGEGAMEEGRFRKPFKLKPDGENYRIPIRLAEDVPPGVTGRWRFEIDADVTSVQDFRIVFQLADGRDVATRPVNLLYFKPRPHPHSEQEEDKVDDGE